jgi:hypothetical protein
LILLMNLPPRWRFRNDCGLELFDFSKSLWKSHSGGRQSILFSSTKLPGYSPPQGLRNAITSDPAPLAPPKQTQPVTLAESTSYLNPAGTARSSDSFSAMIGGTECAQHSFCVPVVKVHSSLQSWESE